MRSAFLGGSDTAPSTTVVNYANIVASNNGTWNATLNNVASRLSGTGTLENFWIYITTAPGAAKSYVFEIWINNASTGVNVTLTGTGTGSGVLFGNSTATVAYAANDTIALKCTPSGTPASTGVIAWHVTKNVSSSDVTDHWTGRQNGTLTGTIYKSPQSVGGPGSEAQSAAVMPTGGVVSNLYISDGVGASVGNTHTWTLMKNGVATTLVVNITTPASSGNDTTHSVTYAAGDTISLQGDPTDTGISCNGSWGMTFTPTNPNESVILHGGASSPSASATNYNQIVGRGDATWDTVENNVQLRTPGMVCKNLYCTKQTAPGSAKHFVWNLRKNATNTDLSVDLTGTIAPATGNDTSGKVYLVEGDELTMQSVPSGTPSTGNGCGWGFVVLMASLTDVIKADQVVTTRRIG